MAVQTIYLLSTVAVTPNWWGNTQLNGTQPTQVRAAFGWGPAKTAVTTPYYRGRIGATAVGGDASVAASYNAASTGPTKGSGSGATTAGDSFISGPFTGTFANTPWIFNCNLQATTAGAIGHINLRVWRSSNADGTAATQVVANTAGATVTVPTSGAVNSSLSFSPGALTLTNQYLFFQVEWQETTAGSSNNNNVLFLVGGGAIGMTTADFVAAATATLSVTQANQTVAATGNVPAVGTLALTEISDTFVGAGGPRVGGALALTEINDTLAAAGAIISPPATGDLALTEISDTVAALAGATVGGSLGLTETNDTLAATGAITSPADVVLLCHFDGAAFADASSYAHTLTPAGSVTLDATNPKFGPKAAYFALGDGSSSIDTGNAIHFQFGSQPFTIETWAYFTIAPPSVSSIISTWENTADLGWYFGIISDVFSFAWTTDGSAAAGGTFDMLQSGGGGPPLNSWVHLAVDWDASNTLRLYVNGTAVASRTSPHSIWPSSRICTIGSDHTGGRAATSSYLDEVRVVRGTAMYGGSFTPPTAPFLPAEPTGPPPLTATLSLTEAPDAIAAAGAVIVLGTLTTTEALDTIAAAGGPRVSGTLTALQAAQTIVAAGGPVASAALAVLQAAQTLVAAGGPRVSGTLTATEALDTIVAAAGPVVRGTLTANQAAQTLAGTGSVVTGASGALVITQAAQTLAATGAVSSYGAEEGVQAPNVVIDQYYAGPYRVGNEVHFVVSGQITQARFYRQATISVTSRSLFLYDAVAGTLIAISNATVAEAGGGWIQAAFPSPIPVVAGSNYVISYDAPDIFAYAAVAPPVTNPAHATWITGRYADGVGSGYPANSVPNTNYAADVIWQPMTLGAVLGALSANQAAQILVAIAGPIAGAALNVNQAAHTIIAQGRVVVGGSLTVNQAAQTIVAAGAPRVGGTLSIVQAANIIASTGSVIVRGQLTANQAAQTLAATGSVLSGASGSLAAIEPPDAAVFAGQVTGIAGSLAATGPLDTAVFAGTVFDLVSGILAATEPPDHAAVAGAVISQGSLAATDNPDHAAFTADLVVAGSLAATDAVDTASFTGGIFASGVLAATEAPDAALFVGLVLDEGVPGVPGPIPDVPYDRQTYEAYDRLVVAGSTGDRVVGNGAGSRMVGNGAGNRVIRVPPVKRVA